MSDINSLAFWFVIGLILIAVALTGYVFRNRIVEPGPKKGVAADPQKVRRQNPPD